MFNQQQVFPDKYLCPIRLIDGSNFNEGKYSITRPFGQVSSLQQYSIKYKGSNKRRTELQRY